MKKMIYCKDLAAEPILDSEMTSTPKMMAFMELEKMLVPISTELDYDKELAEARNEKYDISRGYENK